MRREKAEARAEGLAEALTALRQSILEVVKARFDPPVSHYQRIEAYLAAITDLTWLRDLLLAVIHTDDLASFEKEVAAHPPANMTTNLPD